MPSCILGVRIWGWWDLKLAAGEVSSAKIISFGASKKLHALNIAWRCVSLNYSKDNPPFQTLKLNERHFN